MSISAKNEKTFSDICEKLKNAKRKTIWTPIFEKIENPMQYHYEDLGEIEVIGHLNSNSRKRNSACKIPKIVGQSDVTDSAYNDIQEQIDQDKVVELKNMLLSISEGQLVEEQQLDLELFQSVPAASIPLLCDKLEIHSMDEAAVATLLKTLSCLDQPICQSSATAFVQHVVYPRVMDLKNNGSRALIGSIVMYAECYSRAVIEGLFLPCLNSNTNGPIQTDMLIKIVKCNLPDDLIFLCEKKCIEITEVNDNTFFLVQCVIEKKALQDPEFFDTLLRKLKDWSLIHNSNLKFTKLLIAVATVLGNKMDADQLAVLKEIIGNNKTLLKKAAENILNKIKK